MPNAYDINMLPAIQIQLHHCISLANQTVCEAQVDLFWLKYYDVSQHILFNYSMDSQKMSSIHGHYKFVFNEPKYVIALYKKVIFNANLMHKLMSHYLFITEHWKTRGTGSSEAIMRRKFSSGTMHDISCVTIFYFEVTLLLFSSEHLIIDFKNCYQRRKLIAVLSSI